MHKAEKLISFIRETFNSPKEFISLHTPFLNNNDYSSILETLKEDDLSTNGLVVKDFEKALSEKVGSKYAIATNSGTSALHLALLVNGVEKDTEVITSSFSFIASANAIKYCNAFPVFLDIDKETLGLSVESVSSFLKENTKRINGSCINKVTGRRISAMLPVHTFGISVNIERLLTLASTYGLPVIEDAAEALGSTFNDKYLGTFGNTGIFSFNGNKTITSGGGGAVVTDNELLARELLYLSKTAKEMRDSSLFYKDLGFNYRMPGLNASIVLPQLERLDSILKYKRKLHNSYVRECKRLGIELISNGYVLKSNCWLNTIVLKNDEERNEYLSLFKENNLEARPSWRLIHEMPYYKDCFVDKQENASFFSSRLLNLPSGSIKPSLIQ